MIRRPLLLFGCIAALQHAATAEPLAWDEKVRLGQRTLEYATQQATETIEGPVWQDGRWTIKATVNQSGSYAFVPIPPHIAPSKILSYLSHQPFLSARAVTAGSVIERRLAPGELGAGSGPLHTRWILARRSTASNTSWEPASHAAWATSIPSTRQIPKTTSHTIKGIGGIDTPRQLDDLVALGIGHATVNVHLTGLLLTAARPGTEAYQFEGTTYFISQGWRKRLDDTISHLSQNKIVVSAILLITPPRGERRHLMIHPEADPAGTLAMPNLTTPEGTHAYRAALEFLAERYTREDAEFGRISNWIAHNEVDQAWTWTNMGEQPMPRLLEVYYRSMRLIHGSTRKYDPHARVFASFTHHWFQSGNGTRTYQTRAMLELLNRLSKVEGDFDWGIAYHPYPSDLRKQRYWEDREPTFRFDTPKITLKNIEVLVAFLDEPEFRFDKRPRPLILSEQGFHTPNYSEQHQRDQAAALVHTWHKLRALPAIEAFHYHRWFDNPHEGGLKLGLRTLASPDKPIGEPKLAWHLYQALGTAREPHATAFAKDILGIEDFATIPYRGPIPSDKPSRP